MTITTMREGKKPKSETSDERPSMESLLISARSLVPLIKNRAQRIEAERRVPQEVIDPLRSAGLFRLMQPARFGGFEYGFAELIDVTSELARGCGSTAWCYGIAAAHQWLIAKFPLQAQVDVWGSNSDAIVCGSYAPSAKAIACADGFRVSGRWGFASNSDNCEWAVLGVLFVDDDGDQGKAKPGFVLVPRDHYELADDWFTSGLAGTGSKTVEIKGEVTVPPHRVLTFEEASSNNPPGASVHKNAIYRIPFLAASPVAIVSPALGMVQGALEDFMDMVSGRTTRGAVAGAGARMMHFAHVQSRIAEASAAVDAAKTLLRQTVRELEADAMEGRTISLEKRIRSRRNQAYAVRLATMAINSLFDAVGGGGIHLSSSIQRHWRDVNAVAHHISFNWEAVSTMYGQYCLGLEPKGQY